MMHNYDEPVYLISVVAKTLDIHPQTLRQYEREGLVIPSRTGGRIRLYSQRDVDKIKMVLRLTRELGVNLAGVDIVLRLKVKIEEMDNEMEYLRSQLQKNSQMNTVPNEKSLVRKRSSYEIVIFEE